MPSSISFLCFVIVANSLCSSVLLPAEPLIVLTGSFMRGALFGFRDGSSDLSGLGLLLALLLIFLGLGNKSEDEPLLSSSSVKEWLNS